MLADEDQQALDALLTRRRQLIEMLSAERNRLGQTLGSKTKLVKKSLKSHISYLERELRVSDTELADMIRSSALWRERDDLLHKAITPGPLGIDITGGAAVIPPTIRSTNPYGIFLVDPTRRNAGTAILLAGMLSCGCKFSTVPPASSGSN
jgi:hypothetical protein